MKRAKQLSLIFDAPTVKASLRAADTRRPNRLRHLSTLGTFVDLSRDQQRELADLIAEREAAR
jgi:hypothetical protein